MTSESMAAVGFVVTMLVVCLGLMAGWWLAWRLLRLRRGR